VCRGEVRLARAVAQRAPQMAGAIPGQGEEPVLVEPDQRRFQQAGEVEVVLRQQREPRHRPEVLDGELLAQVQPVDAGHLELLALQLADQRIHERVPPAHQHHEMAFVQQLALARAPLVADQALGMDRDQPREPLVRRGQHAAGRLDGGRVGLDLLGGNQRPELDPAGVLLAAVLVDHLRPGRGKADRGRFPRRTPSRRVEDGGSRAEGDGEVHRLEPLRATLILSSNMPRICESFAGSGALEARRSTAWCRRPRRSCAHGRPSFRRRRTPR
jgi:hypothetical protein